MELQLTKKSHLKYFKMQALHQIHTHPKKYCHSEVINANFLYCNYVLFVVHIDGYQHY